MKTSKKPKLKDIIILLVVFVFCFSTTKVAYAYFNYKVYAFNTTLQIDPTILEAKTLLLEEPEITVTTPPDSSVDSSTSLPEIDINVTTPSAITIDTSQ